MFQFNYESRNFVDSRLSAIRWLLSDNYNLAWSCNNITWLRAYTLNLCKKNFSNSDYLQILFYILIGQFPVILDSGVIYRNFVCRGHFHATSVLMKQHSLWKFLFSWRYVQRYMYFKKIIDDNYIQSSKIKNFFRTKVFTYKVFWNMSFELWRSITLIW